MTETERKRESEKQRKREGERERETSWVTSENDTITGTVCFSLKYMSRLRL